MYPIEMKVTEQYFPCGAAYYAVRGVSNFFSLRMKSLSVTIQMKATEQYFPVVLPIMLYNVVLTFESVDEMPKCGHVKATATEQYVPVISLICCPAEGPSFLLRSIDETLIKMWPPFG